MQLTEGVDINRRTAQRRIKEPEMLTIKELLALAAQAPGEAGVEHDQSSAAKKGQSKKASKS